MMNSTTSTTIDGITMTVLNTSKGQIAVVHQITIGDLLISTSLIAILIFMVISRVIRR